MSHVIENEETLTRFGFLFEQGGVHLARTMMFHELATLLDDPNGPPKSRAELVEEVDAQNALGKKSVQSRKLTVRHLSKLYAFESSCTLYRSLSFLWAREEEGRQLLSFLVAYARDAILQATTGWVLDLGEDEPAAKQQLEAFVDNLCPGRFSTATLESTTRNLLGTWTQSGHLVGHSRKKRQRVKPTPASVAMALLMGTLRGGRGELLFETEYMKLLDCSVSQGMELAETASRKGWINTRRIGQVVEVSFPRLLNTDEQELIREQN